MIKRLSTYYQMKQCVIIFLLLGISFGVMSCSNLVKVDAPFTSINFNNVFNRDDTAIAVNNGMLSILADPGDTTSGLSISNLFAFAGVSSDELSLFSLDNSTFNQFYLNSLSSNSDFGLWRTSYKLIFSANAAMDGLNRSVSLTKEVKKQLLGEAKFIRAFCLFYLVNLYGDVPLPLSVDPDINGILPRSSIEDVYVQIINDLKDSKDLLSKEFLSGNLLSSTTERVRPTYWSACALLARVYLYHKDYGLAVSNANELIGESSRFQLDSLDEVFLKNSNESIWQLQNLNNTGANTLEGKLFIIPKEGPNPNGNPVYLSPFLLNNFEEYDNRKKVWINSIKADTTVYYYAYKYKSGASTPNGQTTEYQVAFRLGEQYLIRAEANAQLGNFAPALIDLNIIRKRAGLNGLSFTSKDSLLSSIFHERQVELFTEWGHRWLDLKRTSNIDKVMSVVSASRGSTWSSNWALWPISQSELDADPKLVQNPGY